MSSEKPPITQQPGTGTYGQGYDNIAMQPAYQPQQMGQVVHPGETVIVQPMGMGTYPTLSPEIAAQCPPGMEYMASLDKVSIFQVIHLSEGKTILDLDLLCFKKRKCRSGVLIMFTSEVT